MATSDKEVDYDAAVKPPPEDKHPYGVDCPINRKIQAILAHYEICTEDVAVLVREDLHLKKHFKLANPDGNDEQKMAYFDAVGTITKAVRRRQMLSAVRRILSEKPFAAIKAPVQPAKKVKINANVDVIEPSSDAASADADAAAYDPTEPTKKKGKSAAAPGKGKGAKSSSNLADLSDVSDISDFSDFSDSEGENDDDVDEKDDDDNESGRKCSSRRDINSLFNDVASEVIHQFVPFMCLYLNAEMLLKSCGV